MGNWNSSNALIRLAGARTHVACYTMVHIVPLRLDRKRGYADFPAANRRPLPFDGSCS